MNLGNSAKYALGVTAAVALLAGCSNGNTGSQFAPAAGGAQTSAAKSLHGQGQSLFQRTSLLMPKAVAMTPRKVANNQHAVKPNCCARVKTAFVSDTGGEFGTYASSVQMFDYSSGSYLGSLAAPPEGFLEPQGMCTDKQGNVYIANTEEFSIDVYSHSGTYVRSLSDPDGYPAACAVNKKSGDVAVTNIIDASGGLPGNVIVYTNGTGTPTEYSTGLSEDFFIGYVGNTSTVWISGYTEATYAVGVAALDTTTGSASPVVLNGATIEFPGTVTWSGKLKNMVVGDQETSTFYHVDPTTGNVTGSTGLACSVSFCDFGQSTIKGARILAADNANAAAGIYPWPTGGTPTTPLTGGSFHSPSGTAISPDVPE